MERDEFIIKVVEGLAEQRAKAIMAEAKVTFKDDDDPRFVAYFHALVGKHCLEIAEENDDN